MKKLILFLALLLIIGCDGQRIYFEQAQPTNSEYEYSYDDNSFREKGQLSDSLILKKHKSHYILNQKWDDGWNDMVISIQNIDKLAVHRIGGGLNAYEDEEIEKLKKTTKVKEVFYNNGRVDYYLINPTPKEFNKMVKNKIMFYTATFTRENK